MYMYMYMFMLVAHRALCFRSIRFNPTPDQPTYKMKLNEERNTDAATGQSIWSWTRQMGRLRSSKAQ